LTRDLELKNPEKFGRAFVKQYLNNGFATLSKRDTELLIYYLLEQDGLISRSISNFEVAAKLRINLKKAKSLRLDAYARWSSMTDENYENKVKDILLFLVDDKKIENGSLYVPQEDKHKGYLAFLVEHPVDRNIIEYEIKKTNNIPKYDLNPDVIIFQYHVLIEIARRYGLLKNNIEDVKRSFEAMYKKKISLSDLLGMELKDLNIGLMREALNDAAIKIVVKNVENVSLSGFLKVFLL